jgi:hypothetical protein
MGEEARSVRTLSLATGTVVGFLLAASALILLDHLNIELAVVWRDLFVTQAPQIKSALAFWIIAATALAGGFFAAAVTRFLLIYVWPLRLARWIIGAAIVTWFGFVGAMAMEPAGLDPAAHFTAALFGMMASLIASCLGAFFAAQR